MSYWTTKNEDFCQDVLVVFVRACESFHLLFLSHLHIIVYLSFTFILSLPLTFYIKTIYSTSNAALLPMSTIQCLDLTVRLFNVVKQQFFCGHFFLSHSPHIKLWVSEPLYRQRSTLNSHLFP